MCIFFFFLYFNLETNVLWRRDGFIGTSGICFLLPLSDFHSKIHLPPPPATGIINLDSHPHPEGDRFNKDRKLDVAFALLLRWTVR